MRILLSARLYSLLLLIFSVYFTVSLISYDIQSNSFNSVTNFDDSNKWIVPGQYIVEWFLQLWGLATIAFVPIWLCWAKRLFQEKRISYYLFRLIYSFCSISFLSSIIINGTNISLPNGLNGIVGNNIVNYFDYLSYIKYPFLFTSGIILFVASLGYSKNYHREISMNFYYNTIGFIAKFYNNILRVFKFVYQLIRKILLFFISSLRCIFSFLKKLTRINFRFQMPRLSFFNLPKLKIRLPKIISRNNLPILSNKGRELIVKPMSNLVLFNNKTKTINPVNNKVQKTKLTSPDVIIANAPPKPIFQLPGEDLLENHDTHNFYKLSDSQVEEKVNELLKVLKDFGIKGSIVNVHQGPVVTLYELEPAAGIKSSTIIGLADDVARSLCALSARISVIPGRNVLGIELPNQERDFFGIKSILSLAEYQEEEMNLPLILGKKLSGAPMVRDLSKMPHLLIAGTTGSGKSVAINTMILSLLYKFTPDECKFIMIDPKMLELSVYQDIPHLLTPVVTEAKKAVTALKWAVKEMESRYKNMSSLGVRNMDGYNKRIKSALESGEVLTKRVHTGFDEFKKPIYENIPIDLKPLPYIIVIVDEMADLMLVSGKDIESLVQRLAQMARAAGIHLIMATQRPSVDVITGVIKANFPSRLSFKLISKIDSRTILGEQGAEQLLGMGDMLYMGSGARITRAHCPFVSDKEVENVAYFLKRNGRPEYIDAIVEDDYSAENNSSRDAELDDGDLLYEDALDIVRTEGRTSISYIQRSLRIGYNRAAMIVERMEREGILSPPNQSGKREILLPE